MMSREREVRFPPEVGPIDHPSIFLAGPIQGTWDWQSEATRLIHDQDPHIIVLNPRRPHIDETFDFGKQVDWETHHLAEAGHNGSIMFWLARETEHICWERAYAQTSRFELAEWLMAQELSYYHPSVVLGIEEGFPGARYIRHRTKGPYFATLEETCEAAVVEARR